MFNDFLDQAQALTSAGYFAPAAVVVRTVLEDGLRRLAVRAKIEPPELPASVKMIRPALLPTVVFHRFGESPISGQDIRIKKRYIM